MPNILCKKYFNQKSVEVQRWTLGILVRGGATGGAGGATAPHKGFKKGKILKYGVFSCIKISFSDIFNKEIHALRGLLLRF